MKFEGGLEIKKLDSVESIEAEIKMLQSKLEFYKELEKTKTPVEEAYKKVYRKYPVKEVSENLTSEDNWNIVSWSVFQKAYKQAQKDFKVGKYQDPEKEREEPKTLFDVIRNLGYSCDCSWEIVDAIEEFEKQKIMKNLKTSLKEMVNGDVRPIDDVMKEAKKPQTLYDICADWYKDYDEDHPMDDLVEYIVRNWLSKPIEYKAMGIGKQEWIDGYNAYRKTLIDTLGGESDY